MFVAGTQGTTGQLTLSLPVPNDLALRGRAIAFQGISLSSRPSFLQLTNPAVPVFD